MKGPWPQTILHELQRSLSCVKEQELDELVSALLQPNRRVLCVAVGRVMLSMKAWIKRMKHLGIDINYVGSETEQAVHPGDLLLVASGSGESLFPVGIARKAKSLGVQIAYIGCTPGSTADTLADMRVILPGKTKNSGDDGFTSVQPMSTLFEQELFLLGDVVALEMMERCGLKEADVKAQHANLE